MQSCSLLDPNDDFYDTLHSKYCFMKMLKVMTLKLHAFSDSGLKIVSCQSSCHCLFTKLLVSGCKNHVIN